MTKPLPTKPPYDNAWLQKAIDETGAKKVALAKVIGKDASAISRILRGDQPLYDFQHRALEEFIVSLKEKAPKKPYSGDHLLTTTAETVGGDIPQVKGGEASDMAHQPDHRDVLLEQLRLGFNDLRARMGRLEDDVRGVQQEMHNGSHFRKGRRRTAK